MGESVNQFADNLLRDFLNLRPDLAANLGINKVGSTALATDTLPDYSQAGLDNLRRLVADRSEALKRLSGNELSAEEQLTLQVMDYVLNQGFYFVLPGRAGHCFIDNPYPLTHLNGFHSETLVLLTRDHSVSTIEQAQDYLKRVARLPRASTETAELLKRRTAQGIITPAVLIRRSLEDMNRFLSLEIKDNPLYKAFAVKLSSAAIDSESASGLLKRLQSLLRNEVYPAYHLVISELKTQLAQDKQDVGAWTLPDGDEYYAWRLRGYTTTDILPRQAHELGLQEIKRLHREIHSAFDDLEISGNNLTDLFAQLALNGDAKEEDAKFANTPGGRKALLSYAREIVTDMETSCRALFNLWPQTEVEVVPIAQELEESHHSTYSPGSSSQNNNDSGSTAYFEFNLAKSSEQLKWEIPLICYHEVYPGHHLQLSVAKELPNLPLFRKCMLFNAYLEGWAKYAETIPLTNNMIRDPSLNPLIAVCRLRSELYSTVNLALDTGIHWKRWSRAEGIRFFMDNTGVEQPFAEFIVDRIIATPGQVCSYKLGMTKVMALRQQFQQTRGTAFRIQEFHDAVLKHGALPLKILESVVT